MGKFFLLRKIDIEIHFPRTGKFGIIFLNEEIMGKIFLDRKLFFTV